MSTREHSEQRSGRGSKPTDSSHILGTKVAEKQEMHQNYKAILKQRGYSYRKAAPKIGVTFQHLSLVLNGHRKSQRILKAIQSLPNNQE